MKKPQDDIINNIVVVLTVLLMITFCGIVYYFTAQVETNRGCEASAYQATKNGFDLETNLAACKR